jgi:hypothetical protein
MHRRKQSKSQFLNKMSLAQIHAEFFYNTESVFKEFDRIRQSGDTNMNDKEKVKQIARQWELENLCTFLEYNSSTSCYIALLNGFELWKRASTQIQHEHAEEYLSEGLGRVMMDPRQKYRGDKFT